MGYCPYVCILCGNVEDNGWNDMHRNGWDSMMDICKNNIDSSLLHYESDDPGDADYMVTPDICTHCLTTNKYAKLVEKTKQMRGLSLGLKQRRLTPKEEVIVTFKHDLRQFRKFHKDHTWTSAQEYWDAIVLADFYKSALKNHIFSKNATQNILQVVLCANKELSKLQRLSDFAASTMYAVASSTECYENLIHE